MDISLKNHLKNKTYKWKHTIVTLMFLVCFGIFSVFLTVLFAPLTEKTNNSSAERVQQKPADSQSYDDYCAENNSKNDEEENVSSDEGSIHRKVMIFSI